ncbi:MAG: FadR family transcriptional regulator [Rhodospirillales bacterium]|nr:FadR family transcriptional regulator [Rhodospirillales bacterium]MBO6786187.1 FadR family transcriptional regulator [Rhodospirillales bacterium]
MKAKLEPRQSLSAQLVAELREQIANGTFAPGDKLPSENELIQKYSVSRTVVREAISGLRADGILVTRQGVGAFVTNQTGKRLEPFDPRDLEAVLHMIEFRKAIETEAAGFAAARRDENDLKELKHRFDELAAHALDAKAFILPDYNFHLAVAKAAHNPYFQQIEEHIGAQIIPHSKVHVIAPDIPEDLSFLKAVQAEHERIYRAIVDGDVEGARAAMRAHLEHSQERYGMYSAAEQAVQ